jgi:hypothetical protein
MNLIHDSNHDLPCDSNQIGSGILTTLVTTNLAAALREIRLHRVRHTYPVDDLPSFLCVDANCIDQCNVSERGS